MKVVLAETDQTHDDFLRRTLIVNGHTITARVQELSGVLSACRVEEPDLLIVGGEFGRAETRDLIQQVRARHPGIGVVAVGEPTDRQQVRQVVESGVNDVLVRPVTEQRLLKAVRRAAS